MTNRETYGDDTVAILDMVATERGRQEFLKSQGKFTYTCADMEMTHAEASTGFTRGSWRSSPRS